MASADEEESGPRGGTDLRASEMLRREPEAPRPAGPAHNAPTQQMPLVNSPTSGPPVVRAVAKRAPAALPALGGPDGPRDAPVSARATVDRRRQAAALGGAEPAGAPLPPRPAAAAPAGSASAAAGPLAGQPAGEAAPPTFGPAATAAATGDAAEQDLWHLPPPDAPPPTAQIAVRGQASAAYSGDLALAGAPAGHARPAPAVVASGRATGTAPTSLLPVIPDTFDSPSSPGFLEATQAVRTLPPVLDADSWDTQPGELPNQEYDGRRRATALPLRIWLVMGMVLLGLAAAVVVPQLVGSPSPRSAGGAVLTAGVDEPPATAGGELIQPASAPGATATKGEPKVSGSVPGGAATTTGASAPGPNGPSTATGPAGPFQLSLAAVDTHSYQSWQRQDNVCGGSVILIGDWGDPPKPQSSPPGTLTFANISVPATGSYTMVITYAITVGGARNATITVNGSSSGSNSFPPACTGTRSVPITLDRTTGNTIVFSNNTSTAPSIQKIVISKA